MKKPAPQAASIAPDEVAHFARLAADWWNADGEMGILHRMNPVRLGYIRDQICSHFKIKTDSVTPLYDLNILDIGCGGGILTEPLARMGANVTGIDATEEAIGVAATHAEASDLSIDYHCSSAEEFAKQGQLYDVITLMEIVEHVADLPSLLTSAAKMLKPDGLLFISTVNRTASSFMKAIVAAEYLLHWVPRGTHSWRKFVRPSELAEQLGSDNITMHDITGITYDVLSRGFCLSPAKVGNTYITTAIKQK